MAPSAVYPEEHIGRVPKYKSDSASSEHDNLRGWPSRLKCALSWAGSDFVNEAQFVYELSAQDKDEIESALSHFKSNSRFGLIECWGDY